MNYIILFTEMIFVFVIMYFLYKYAKKDGLYLGISIFAVILCLIQFRMIDIFLFSVSMGIPLVIGILALNNIIIHRYGIDEVKRIILTFTISYTIIGFVIMFSTAIMGSQYNLVSNNDFDMLFGYSLYNIRHFIGGFIATSVMLLLDSNIYYSIRKSKNNLLLDNLGAIFIVLFVESLIYVLLSSVGVFNFVRLFGMMVIRYLKEVVLGLIGIIPIWILVKMKDK